MRKQKRIAYTLQILMGMAIIDEKFMRLPLYGLCLALFYLIISIFSEFFAIKMFLLSFIVIYIPTFSNILNQRIFHFSNINQRISRILFETIFFMVLILFFYLWSIGPIIFSVWIIYALILILLLEIGSHFVDLYNTTIQNRLSNNSLWEKLSKDVEIINKMIHDEPIMYISIPLGLIIGTLVGIVLKWTPQLSIIFSIQIILILASIVIIYFLLISFKRMSQSLYQNEKFISLRKYSHDQDNEYLELANMIAELRKIYLYDAMHNVFLFIGFLAILLNLTGVTFNIRLLVINAFLMSFLFNQLPYVIGQKSLHNKILENYKGIERADIAEKLKKYSPLYPTSDFLTTLITSGTAGGLIYYSLYQIVENFI